MRLRRLWRLLLTRVARLLWFVIWRRTAALARRQWAAGVGLLPAFDSSCAPKVTGSSSTPYGRALQI